MGKLKTLTNRIYSDYIMPSRLDEYEKIIINILNHGYKCITLREYSYKLKNNLLGEKKYFINRHDIDTDVNTAKDLFKIEKKYNIKATYYFRLTTLDFDFMKNLEDYGSEASYHFEEIASFCKKHHINSKEEVIRRLSDIRILFKKNFITIESKLGVKLQTVCAHGDFVNRKLQITNSIITKDIELRKELGIKSEVYDDDLMKSFDIYISDRPYPYFYNPENIFKYIGNKKTICFLSHPRHWKTNLIENSKDNIKRLYEGLIW